MVRFYVARPTTLRHLSQAPRERAPPPRRAVARGLWGLVIVPQHALWLAPRQPLREYSLLLPCLALRLPFAMVLRCRPTRGSLRTRSTAIHAPPFLAWLGRADTGLFATHRCSAHWSAPGPAPGFCIPLSGARIPAPGKKGRSVKERYLNTPPPFLSSAFGGLGPSNFPDLGHPPFFLSDLVFFFPSAGMRTKGLLLPHSGTRQGPGRTWEHQSPIAHHHRTLPRLAGRHAGGPSLCRPSEPQVAPTRDLTLLAHSEHHVCYGAMHHSSPYILLGRWGLFLCLALPLCGCGVEPASPHTHPVCQGQPPP